MLPPSVSHHLTNFQKVLWPKLSGVKRGEEPLPSDLSLACLQKVQSLLPSTLMLPNLATAPGPPSWSDQWPEASLFVINANRLTWGFEALMFPTLRLNMLGGCRAVVIASFQEVAAYMSKVGSVKGQVTASEAAVFIKGLTRDGLTKFSASCSRTYIGTCGPGDLLYIAPGHLFVEQSKQQEIFGLKLICVPKTDLKVAELLNEPAANAMSFRDDLNFLVSVKEHLAEVRVLVACVCVWVLSSHKIIAWSHFLTRLPSVLVNCELCLQFFSRLCVGLCVFTCICIYL